MKRITGILLAGALAAPFLAGCGATSQEETKLANTTCGEFAKLPATDQLAAAKAAAKVASVDLNLEKDEYAITQVSNYCYDHPADKTISDALAMK